MMQPVKGPTVTKKGVTYFQSFDDAVNVQRNRVPFGRLVRYDLGWAIQYWASGPYYPQHEMK